MSCGATCRCKGSCRRRRAADIAAVYMPIRRPRPYVQILPLVPPDPNTEWAKWWAWNYLQQTSFWVPARAGLPAAWILGFRAGSAYALQEHNPTSTELREAGLRGEEISAIPRSEIGWSEAAFYRGFDKALMNFNAIAVIWGIPLTWDYNEARNEARNAWMRTRR